MALYDVSFGGIALPTFEQDFTETVGAPYEQVGAAVLPGAPAPLSLYNVNLDVYGDPTETNPTAVGFTKRAQVKALLQNALTRYQGIQLTCAFDTALNGYLVVGNAEIAYGQGGATFGDFQVRISGAAWIAAVQSLLGLRLVTHDRRLADTPLDRRMQVYREAPLDKAALVHHHLPVGATDVYGQAEPVVPKLHTYDTLHGKGAYVEGRPHLEVLQYEQPWELRGKDDVRVFDARQDRDQPKTAAGDLDPEGTYHWVRMYGPAQAVAPGALPVLDNGRCRVLYSDGKLVVQQAQGGKYVDAQEVALGYPRVGRAWLAEYSTDHALVKAALLGQGGRAELYLELQRGWPGPQVDVYHQAGQPKQLEASGLAHREAVGAWQHLRVGVGADVGLTSTAAHVLVGAAA